MKKLTYIALSTISLALCSLAPTNASAEFAPPAVSHAYAAKSSIKITEPAGFKVAVTVDGKTTEDTIPHVFALADADAFVPITVTAPDGKQWSGKIEVKAHQQTQLAFKYTAAGPAPAARPAAKFIGHLVNDTDRCHPARIQRVPFRYDVLDEHQAVVAQVDVQPGQDKTAELPAGTYSIRLYMQEGSEWKYKETFKGIAITSDRWGFGLGCTKKNGTAVERTR